MVWNLENKSPLPRPARSPERADLKIIPTEATDLLRSRESDQGDSYKCRIAWPGQSPEGYGLPGYLVFAICELERTSRHGFNIELILGSPSLASISLQQLVL